MLALQVDHQLADVRTPQAHKELWTDNFFWSETWCQTETIERLNELGVFSHTTTKTTLKMMVTPHAFFDHSAKSGLLPSQSNVRHCQYPFLERWVIISIFNKRIHITTTKRTNKRMCRNVKRHRTCSKTDLKWTLQVLGISEDSLQSGGDKQKRT
jgi:hypothetical protein